MGVGKSPNLAYTKSLNSQKLGLFSNVFQPITF